MRNALILLGAMIASAAIFTPREGDGAAKPVAAAAAGAHTGSGFARDDEIEGPASTDPNGPTVLLRDETGQFRIAGQVEGQDTRFLVDTGADVVALTVDEAQRLGLGVDRSQFQPLTQTASGVGYGAEVTLRRLEVAGTELRDVHALVVDGLSTNLLGQNVLKQIGRVELSGDRMVIRR